MYERSRTTRNFYSGSNFQLEASLVTTRHKCYLCYNAHIVMILPRYNSTDFDAQHYFSLRLLSSFLRLLTGPHDFRKSIRMAALDAFPYIFNLSDIHRRFKTRPTRASCSIIYRYSQACCSDRSFI